MVTDGAEPLAYAPSGWAVRAAGVVARRAGTGDGWTARLAASGDLAAITALERAGYGEASEVGWAFVAKANAGVLVVACVEEAIAGYGLALLTAGSLPTLDTAPAIVASPTTLHVHDVCVGAPFRGRRIATALMGGFVDLAADLDLTRLTAVAVNGAEALWCSIGWRLTGGEPPTGYPPGSLPIERDVQLDSDRPA